MGISMKVNGKMVNVVDKVCMNIRMGMFMMENGLLI